jgi:hypothetical protein
MENDGPKLRFRDLDGRYYAIPEYVLAEYELSCDLPDGVALTGLEDDQPTRPVPAMPVRWHVVPTIDQQSLHYVIAAPPTVDCAGPPSASLPSGINIWCGDGVIAIEIPESGDGTMPHVTAVRRGRTSDDRKG